MEYPKYDFSDPSLDYEEVKATVYQMYSDLNVQHGCCGNSRVKAAFQEVEVPLNCIVIDQDDEERYKEDIKTAYTILYNVA